MAADGTHHVLGGAALYLERFDEVLKFHEPGLAPVRRDDAAWHIRTDGSEAYGRRFMRTFGFYDGLAAVTGPDGWHHIRLDGTDISPARFEWCGNFQGGRCAVRERGGGYLHLRFDGTPAYTGRWRYAGDFRDGIGVVQEADGRSTHIDPHGEPIHGKWFLDLDVFHKGFARARDKEGWTHVDASGRPTYARRFAAIEPFYNGQARVERSDGALEVIDEAGRTMGLLRAPTKTPLERLSGLMVGFWGTQAIRAAAGFQIIDHLPGEVGDVAAKASLPQDAALRLLRALWELDLVRRKEQLWVPTDTGALLHSQSPSGMADAAQHWGAEHYTAWAELASSLATGEPGFERVHGRPFFDWLADEPAQLERYHRAMQGYAEHDYECLHDHLPLDGVRHVVDAGGGSGALVRHLLASRADVTGTLLDLPEVVASSPLRKLANQRLRLVGADLFSPWPCKADLVVLARVLHDWGDERARTILQHARRALEPGGQVALVEFVVEDNDPNGALLDLNMLAICGARERTLHAWTALARSAGFQLSDVAPLPTYGAVLTLKPAPRQGGGPDA